MKIDTHILNKLLHLIDYYVHCPFPGGRLELPPAIERAVYRQITKLHKQLGNSDGSDPVKVAKSIRALHRLIAEPLRKVVEHHHAQLRALLGPGQTQRGHIVDLMESFGNDLLATFEEAGTSPIRSESMIK